MVLLIKLNKVMSNMASILKSFGDNIIGNACNISLSSDACSAHLFLETSVIEKMNINFNCPDCQSQSAISRTFSKHVQKTHTHIHTHKGSYSTISKAVKRGNSETNNNESASSVLVKHHKVNEQEIVFSVDNPITFQTLSSSSHIQNNCIGGKDWKAEIHSANVPKW
ncbi:hypothetical protein BCV72DRAFT_128310 [Rhizopus microsporus var. microsporus]|uniref:Uncharacterized protein n=2 Tax=Rhizopus microsporus TaxID=58291 RepID=A0A2G4T4A6_RHIZD|nr:uncharacterized protein RHIMIDRAFT_89769 [Rhizopus microsporus ATCC 52813]ORE06156.1 hypothetical protein BCV72DRAFT_128310 [Rhizopus microsporus var. microsporus]PHZ15516.1 hypothetical protein RHIMIDRAFT_89769 [Rhizopus microsporus ATCC 52813]